MSENIQSSKSLVLEGLAALPGTACVGCPNAIWQSVAVKDKESLRIFCLLMHAVIDEMINKCDGVTYQPNATSA